MISPFLGVFFIAWLNSPNPTPPANIMTLSKDCKLLFSLCSNVNKEPTISGCPKQLPKSEAPLDAFTKISNGVWYFQILSEIFFSHGLLLSNLEYGVMYTADPISGMEPVPPEARSLISPPEPVAAPLYGSTVVGKLCVSAFSEIILSISLLI